MSYPPCFRILPAALVIVSFIWGVFEVIDARSSQVEKDLDHHVVRILRQPDQPARMIGPPQLEEAMRDFTALGGYSILITTVIGFSVFAFAELGPRTFHFFWLTSVGGFVTGLVMKRLVQRERPSIVPHLSHVSGHTSFPSSHAMMSVIVYVTIGYLLAQQTTNQHLRRLLVGLPFTIAAMVGISRVCMGVHFPTDVLGGWTGGLLWIWIAFTIRSRGTKSATIPSQTATD